MQSITDFWKTTTGKFTIIGGGGIAGLFSICFICAICSLLIKSNDAVQEAGVRLTRTPRNTSPTEAPSRLQPIATPIELIPANTPTAVPPLETPVIEEVIPAATPIPEVLKPFVTASKDKVNLRSGPGTNYEIVGTLLSGESLEIVGRNADSSWWQISTQNGLAWTAAEVVTASNADNSVPVVEAPPAPIPTEPPPAEPMATEQPPVEACDCSEDHYNCPDFSTYVSAQVCYEYCKSIGHGDVHNLDRDDDGIACDPSNW